MRIALDWDGEDIREMHEDEALAHARGLGQQRLGTGDLPEPPRPAELWRSSGGDGYHFIEFGGARGYRNALDLREEFGDDRLRISLDSDRLDEGSPFYSVLYNAKRISATDTPPFDTTERAALIDRFHAATGPVEFVANGRFDYASAFRGVLDAGGYDSRTELLRVLRERFDRFRRGSRTISAPTDTRASARAYDLINGRRTPHPAERAALVGLVHEVVLSQEIPDFRDYIGRLSDMADYSGATDVLRAARDRMEETARNRDVDVPTDTRASARAYDLANGRRSAHPAERVALFELAAEAGLVGEDRLEGYPRRTTIHEYAQAADLGEDFDLDVGESKRYNINMRVGWQGPPGLKPVGEATDTIPDLLALKGVLDALSSEVRGILAPGPLEASGRLSEPISLEKERRIDPDEVGANRRTLMSDPNDVPGDVRDAFRFVVWEVIVWKEGMRQIEWVARGLTDPENARACGEHVRMNRAPPVSTWETAIPVRDSNEWMFNGSEIGTRIN